ncbi:acetylxylan esterase [Jeotgalibacillus haloalkalitolerans]|uniref:Acetylxylan esterase n=1 Tax=Jeotgalibacillus haloalkalitolerans TaxID=3104292 RepID=A0ABU5KIY0_9BACL|nr:acetylxylan esterase [Jeotgalibacillus sp. HH7-29]MDZ5710685.1 acetylxylan esterase [Jeotgalibacillus sp. HH7-29]
MQIPGFSFEELRSYQPLLTKEDDFDRFWRERVKENEQYRLNVTTKERSYPVEGIKVYDVYFDGFRNSRIHAAYVCPENVKNDAPVALIFHGYNWNTLQPNYAFKYAVQGIPALMVEVRGQNHLSPDMNHYEHGHAAGWMSMGLSEPDHYYYSFVYMDCFRSADVAVQLSGGKKVFVEGGSQGGGLAIATAALRDDILFALCDIPFLTQFEHSVRAATEGPYTELAHYFKVHDPAYESGKSVYSTLSYVDCLNLAEKVTCPVFMSIGLEDPVCPPQSGFALFNYLGGRKEIRTYPHYGHEVPAVHEEEKLAFVAAMIEQNRIKEKF